MDSEQLTLLHYATAELSRVQQLALGQSNLLPLPITTKAAAEAGIPRSAMQRAKTQGPLDYFLPRGEGKVRIEFVGQSKHKDFWRIWKY
jgi:hypothetical protein